MSLTEQVVAGLRAGICSGVWKPGTPLPTRSALVKTLGVSKNVVQQAIARLTAEHLIVSHGRCGCVVKRSPAQVDRRRVLEVSPGYEASFWHARFVGALQERLSSSRVLCGTVSLPRVDRGCGLDFAALDDKFVRAQPDLCVVTAGAGDVRAIVRHLEKMGVPYVLMTGEGACAKSAHCLGCIRSDYAEALTAFVADCRAAGITSVLWFAWSEKSFPDPRPQLERAGIHVETLTLMPGSSVRDFDEIFASAGNRMRERLARGPLCDLIFVTDDYMAMGALPVLLERGVRIPEDVRFVTLRNKGGGPAFTKTLAAIETDPRQRGASLAEQILAWFETGTFAVQPTVPRYVWGETFPVGATRTSYPTGVGRGGRPRPPATDFAITSNERRAIR